MGAFGVPLDPLEGAGVAVRPCLVGALAEELVEVLTVDHADEAVLDRDVDLAAGGRDHAGGVDLGDDLIVGDLEVLDERGAGSRRRRA